MGIFDGTGLDPEYTPGSDIWPATLAELQQRDIEIHGSLSKGSVEDGATAFVVKGTETASGRVVAIKVYKDPNQQVRHRNGDTIPMTNFFENERRMLVGLQPCPAVPRYFYSVDDSSTLTDDPIQPFHVMEFIAGQRVTKFAKDSLNNEPKKRPDRLIRLLRGVLQTIESIHQFGYLHRDISDGNVLVDGDGKIRLIDLAEASPLGEEHTRLVTTPGLGTDGTASEAQQKVRAIQTDDVNHACTIGYALFTGRWKQKTETPADWYRSLTNAGTPAGIARILTKGMKARDTNQKIDRAVWNTAKEVDVAIQSVLDRQRTRRQAVRGLFWTTIVAAVVIAIGFFVSRQIQQQTYYVNQHRLNEQRIVLGDKPQKFDSRVRAHIQTADALEQEAATANRSGNTNEAADLLEQAVNETQQANALADDLQKITPLLKPLRAMLHENQQWNTDCDAIRDQLTAMQQDYLQIKQQMDSDTPAVAWKTMSQLQADLVHVIADNQQSYEIAALFDQFDGLTIGLSHELTARTDYQRIAENRIKAEQNYFQLGRWLEAKTAMLSHQQALQVFLEKHENEDQKKSRLAANADLVNDQIAANQALQKQLSVLSEQLREKQNELDKLDDKNSDILIVSAKDRAARDEANQQLADVRTQLDAVSKTLKSETTQLAEARKQLESLTAQTNADGIQLADYKQRLATGSAAQKQQSSDLTDLKRKLELAESVITRMQDQPGANAEDAAMMIRVAGAETAIREFDPHSWDVAHQRLLDEAAAYERLAQKRQAETAIGKTDRHIDIQRIDTQLQSQFRVVVAALTHRDMADVKAWQALESQITHQQTLRDKAITDGWAQTSKAVRDIDAEITIRQQKQKSYQVGKSRHEQNDYQFASWEKLAELPDVKYAKSLATFGKLKTGSRFTNSLGQAFVYLPAGTFEMGSPTTETGRDDDEGKQGTHTVELTDGFFMAIHEMTQGPYLQLTGEAPWKGQEYGHEGDDYPATYVSWDDATNKFLPKLNAAERAAGALPPGWEYGLPSEAQWEYAARAGTQTRFSFGSDESQLGEYAWFDDNAWDIGEKYAHRVGKKQPNKWGLYDTAGNVWEWTADFHGDYPSSSVVNPTGTDGGSIRVGRGGCFDDSASFARPAFRARISSGDRNGSLGFRLALDQLQATEPDLP